MRKSSEIVSKARTVTENHGSGKPMEIQRMRITALPAGKEKLGSALASLTGPREALQGCLNCSITQGFRDNDDILVELDWESKEDLIRYLQSPTYKQLLLLAELSPKAPVIQFFTVTELRGLDLVEAVREPAATS